MEEEILAKALTSGLKLCVSRWMAAGGDGRVFGIEFSLPVSCNKHRVAESAIFKNGSPSCKERHVTTDEFGQEWIDLDAILKYLEPYQKKCPIIHHD